MSRRTGKRLDNVAERAGLQDEDFHAETRLGAPLLRGEGLRGRPHVPGYPAVRQALRSREAGRLQDLLLAVAMSYSCRRNSIVPSSMSYTTYSPQNLGIVYRAAGATR